MIITIGALTHSAHVITNIQQSDSVQWNHVADLMSATYDLIRAQELKLFIPLEEHL